MDKVCDLALDALQNSQFWVGALAGFVAALVLVLIWKCISFRGSLRKEITIEDSEKGTFTIASSALMAFVRSIAIDFKEVEVTDFRLVERRDGLAMVIEIRAFVDTELVKCLGRLRELLAEEMKAKLGIIDQIKSIDFETHELVKGEKEA